MKKLIIFKFALILGGTIAAQDGHFSQFWNAPMYYNPAAAGLGHDNFRLTNNYRSQWNPVQPISTFDIAFDKYQNNWGYGLLWSKNGAGNASIQTNNLLINAAHHISTSDGGKLSLGFQGGLFQRSIDPTGITFESQYNAETLEIMSESGENFLTTSTSLMDMNVGLMYSVQSSSIDIMAGAAMGHVFEGDHSFHENAESILPRKLTAMGQIGLHLDSTMTLKPGMLYQNQGHASQTNLSLLVEKRLWSGKTVEAGIGARLKDAYILYAGIDVGQAKVSMSYDVNSSTLNRATNGFGAFELALIFTLGETAHRPRPPKQQVNPDQRTTHRTYPAQRQTYVDPNPRMVDSDGDGVADPSDHCPWVAGDPKNMGCPGKIDSDQDGLTDDVDMCPFMYGLPVQSGCPDTDGDGIADIDDACPTVYGAMNLMGCPDSDRDGISDKEDHCPTLFGLMQNHGCPDAKTTVIPYGIMGTYQPQGLITPNLNTPMGYIPAQGIPQQQVYQPTLVQPQYANPNTVYPEMIPQQYGGQDNYVRSYPQNVGMTRYADALVLDNFYVNFDKDSDQLTYEAKKQLRDYVVALGLNADYKLLISGHTDDEGGPHYNVMLGQKRADQVRSYLEGFGLDNNRIISISYGEAMPVVPNNTVDGQARNRRVEVLLVK